MSEIADVLAAIEALSANGERMALATVVAVRGSTYRRPGARLLIPEHGAPIGNISGGCLEGDVADVGRIVMDEGTPRLATWDLTAEDDAVWGLGLGCNGAIEVYIEPAREAGAVAGALHRAIGEARPICLVTVIRSSNAKVPSGARLLWDPSAPESPESPASLGDAAVDVAARAAAAEQSTQECSAVRELGPDVQAFVEVLEPPLHLVVCGAGHDAVPLVHAAAVLGWRIDVVDERAAFLSRERFPDASGFVLLDEPEEVGQLGTVTERTFAVVMTHRYERDLGYLEGLSRSPARYIGALGPAARTERMLHDLSARGVATDAFRARLHGPAGLDLGSEGPEEIAQSILAEIIAVKRGRDGGPLRARPGPIHDRQAR
ncbi:MAG: xanthine dehydrogenase accessory factor [Actinomycetota bacterium]|nr:xanthine dehydrogenase accessory factor [Actinomycetota bacterium]